MDSFFKTLKGLDSQLESLLENALLYVDADTLKTYLSKTKRFDVGPVTVINDGEPKRTVYWWNLREDLEQLPFYFESAAKAALSRAQSVDLLFTLVDNEKYDFCEPVHPIKCLTQAFASCAENKINMVDHLDRVKDLMACAHEDGEMARALGIFQLGLAARFTVDQSVQVVEHIYEKAWNSGYGLMGLYDELNLLSTHAVDPALLQKTLLAIGTREYKDFTNSLYLASTEPAFSQHDVMTRILDQVAKDKRLDAKKTKAIAKKTTDRASALERVMGKMGRQLEAAPKSPAPKALEDYFPMLQGARLMHGILPYRLEKNFRDGVNDLRILMEEKMAEGVFIFDPDCSVWYSLGGRTVFGLGRVRHEFLPYDVSALSQNPVFVHIHPKGSETFVAPCKDDLQDERMFSKLKKLFAAEPSGADFQLLMQHRDQVPAGHSLKGAIVTSSGLTAYSLSPERAADETWPQTYRALKDKMVAPYFEGHPWHADESAYLGEQAFVHHMIARLDSLLPKGARVSIRPYEDIASAVSWRPAKGTAAYKKDFTLG